MKVHRRLGLILCAVTVVFGWRHAAMPRIALAQSTPSSGAAHNQHTRDDVPELTNDDLALQELAREFHRRAEAELKANAAEGLWLEALYGRAGQALAANRERGRRRALQAAYRIIISDPLIARAWIRVKEATIEIETIGGSRESINYWKRFQRDPF
jgi:hypothetical protein